MVSGPAGNPLQCQSERSVTSPLQVRHLRCGLPAIRDVNGFRFLFKVGEPGWQEPNPSVPTVEAKKPVSIDRDESSTFPTTGRWAEAQVISCSSALPQLGSVDQTSRRVNEKAILFSTYAASLMKTGQASP